MDPEMNTTVGPTANIMPGGMPPPQQGMPEQMATPQQRQQLFDIIDATRGKLGELNTARFSMNNVEERMKSGALKEAFLILQKAGVDLTDPEAVARFLEQLKQANPELYQRVEEAFNALLGANQEPLGQPDHMNETIPEELSRPSVAVQGIPPREGGLQSRNG